MTTLDDVIELQKFDSVNRWLTQLKKGTSGEQTKIK